MRNYLITIFLGILTLFILSGVSLGRVLNIPHDRYITSRDSKYCYLKGEKDLKNKEYHRTLTECGKPLYEKK